MDENEVIIQAVLDLLGDPEKLRQYMGNARELSLNYTWESVACRYIELYSMLLYPGAPNPLAREGFPGTGGYEIQ
jgi:hypothetical protein